MTHARRLLNGARVLLLKHPDAVPSPELRVWLAEMEAALDAETEREIEAMGEKTRLERGDWGYPPEMSGR